MAQKIQIRRGLKADLPSLSEGEFGFCLDTKELFIGTSTGNVLVNNVSWSDIMDKPSFSTVATTGSYNDLSNKPVIPPEYTLPFASKTTLGGVKVGNGISLGTDGTISVSGITVGSPVEVSKTEPIGELFSPPAQYNAWCPTNLQFDKKRGVFACLINGANAHVFTSLTHYFCTINPDNLVASTPKAISIVDKSGKPDSYDANSANNFMVLNDGTYMFLQRKNGIYQRITFEDGGATWVNQGAITVTPNNALTTGSNIWGMTKLSNGRLICGFGAQAEVRGKLIFSDDNGVSWKLVSVGTSIPSGTTSTEPCIIEVSPNNLIALARKSTDGLSKGTVGGTPDPALIAISTDNGGTWTNYKDSTSIINMNASGATAYVHVGIVEVFVASRFYQTSANVNTGKTGAIYHYSATLENALKDNFTLVETVVYAKATNSVDFHSPCVSIDDKNRLLLMYMDASDYYPVAVVNYRFVRGGLRYISYKNVDGAGSPVFSYSGKYIDSLISSLRTDIASLQNAVSQISTGGTGGGGVVTPPKGTLIWTKTYNAQNEQISIDKDIDFTGKINLASTAPNYDYLAVDSSNVTFNNLRNSMGIAIIPTKNNFSISYKGTVGNQLHAPLAAAIIDGVGYGFYDIGDFTTSFNTEVHEYRLEYWNGTKKIFLDGVEVTNRIKTFVFDKNVSAYQYFMNVIGILDSTKIYAISGFGSLGGKVYEMKFGEWDS